MHAPLFYRHSSAINSFFVFTHFFIELHFIKRALFPFLLSKSEFLEAKSARSACARLAKRKSAKSRVTCNSLQLFISTTVLPLSLSPISSCQKFSQPLLHHSNDTMQHICRLLSFLCFYPSILARPWLGPATICRGLLPHDFVICLYTPKFVALSHKYQYTIGQYSQTPIPLQRHL